MQVLWDNGNDLFCDKNLPFCSIKRVPMIGLVENLENFPEKSPHFNRIIKSLENL
jgi:hypothetical protein